LYDLPAGREQGRRTGYDSETIENPASNFRRFDSRDDFHAARYRKPSAFVICAISATYRPNSEKSRGKVGQCFRFFRDFLDLIPNG
jgi:hypothetical protein